MFNLLRRILDQINLSSLAPRDWRTLALVMLAALLGSYELALLKLAFFPL